MADAELVLKQFADQAKACEALGSPFTARICRLLPDRLDLRTRFGRRILEWDGDPYADNVALRACGALHALSRSGWEPDLTGVYPPHQVTDLALWAAIAQALQYQDSFLTDWLSSAPQTNEVARSAALLGAMLRLTERTRLPLDIYEIGASAGLNLGFDRYGYTLGGGKVWGLPNAPLIIESEWRGNAPPLGVPLQVLRRHGCDLRPIDPASGTDRERLLSYIWADQSHRLERVETALAIAAHDGRKVDREGAATWLEHHLGVPSPPGVARIVFHTIVWQYLPADVRARIEALFAEVGAGATAESPFARFSFEADEVPGSARMDLTIWPGGETVTLGRGDFHGRWAEWA